MLGYREKMGAETEKWTFGFIFWYKIGIIQKVIEPRSEKAIERARLRKENREWLSLSQEIALAIHYYIRKAGLTQKELAEDLNVSPAYVAKLLKGGENLTLETICKIQHVKVNKDKLTVVTVVLVDLIVV